MTYPKALFGGFVAIAIAIIVASYAPADAQMSGKKSYMISAYQGVVWRVNRENGSVSYCIKDFSSTDPNFIKRRPPFCSAASSAATH